MVQRDDEGLLQSVNCKIFCVPLRFPTCLGGEMVDTRDLKSLGPKRPCGFDSRPRHKVVHYASHSRSVQLFCDRRPRQGFHIFRRRLYSANKFKSNLKFVCTKFCTTFVGNMSYDNNYNIRFSGKHLAVCRVRTNKPRACNHQQGIDRCGSDFSG